VFFNPFSEVEPFAAILIAHGTHVFLGGLLRPEDPKFEGGFLRRWQ